MHGRIRVVVRWGRGQPGAPAKNTKLTVWLLFGAVRSQGEKRLSAELARQPPRQAELSEQCSSSNRLIALIRSLC